MSCGIYKITNILNQKVYIGQSKNIENRWKAHKCSKDNSIIHLAFKKYGLSNFIFEVIEECPVELLNEKEIYWINIYNSLAPFGYNMVPGGNRPPTSSKAVNQYDLKGNFIATYNSAKIASEITKLDYTGIVTCCRHERNVSGNYQWRYITDTNLQLLTNDKNVIKTKVGIIQYDLNGNKIKEFSSLKEASEQTGITHSSICSVCKENAYTAGGFRWSYADKELRPIKKGKYQAKKVAQYDLNNNLIAIYNSLTEASEKTKISKGNMGSVCRGERKTAGNYIWKYID